MSAYDPIAMLAELETVGVPRQQAEVITGAVIKGRADLVTKADLDAGLSGIRSELLVVRADLNAALNAMALRLFLALTAVMALAMTTVGVLIEIHK